MNSTTCNRNVKLNHLNQHGITKVITAWGIQFFVFPCPISRTTLSVISFHCNFVRSVPTETA